jgi:hypothetical protein
MAPCGPTNPQLHIFLDDSTEIATTAGATYEFADGPACPVSDPRAAAASIRNRLHTQPQESQ